MFKMVLEKAEEPEIKSPISVGSLEKQESFRKQFCGTVCPMSGTFKALREIQKLFLSLEVYQLIAYQMASEDSGIETSPINSEMLTT